MAVDAATALAERTFHLSPSELDDWRRANSELGRRLVEAQGRRRLYDEQQTAAAREAENARLDAEIEAAATTAATPIPSLDECRQRLTSDPDALSRLHRRVEMAWIECRRLDHAPLQRLDNYWQSFRQTLSQRSSNAHALLACHEALRHFATMSARRREFTTMSFVDASAAHPAPLSAGFDAANWLARMATRGVVLSLAPGGKLLALHGMLSEQDRATIAAHRVEIIGALSRLEEV